MGATLTTAASILKTRYLGPVREQLNNMTILMTRIKKDSSTQDVSGTSFTVPLHASRNVNAGMGRAELGIMPTAGAQGWSSAVVPNKYGYTKFQVSGPVIRATRDNVGAFVNIIDAEVQGATRDHKRAMNRQINGDGRDALAFWTTADNSTPASIDDGRGNNFVACGVGTFTCDLTDTDNATKNANSVEFVIAGSKAAGYTAAWASGTVASSGDGDYLVMEDTLGYNLTGIDCIIDHADPPLLAGGLHGLTVALNSWWSSQVVDGATPGTNEALSLERMQQPLDEILINSDYTDADVEFLLCSPGVRAKYISLLVADKRYVNTMKLDGGFEGVDFNGKPLVVDPQCKKNTIFYINPKCLSFFRTSDFDWIAQPMGSDNMLIPVANYDAYEATLFSYGDLGCVCRNGLARLNDVSE
jgi:hypothetical protein